MIVTSIAKTVHGLAMAILLFSFATSSSSLLFPQQFQTLQDIRERTLLSEQRLENLHDRVKTIEGMQLEGRLRVIESVMGGVKDSLDGMQKVQLGQIAGLLGLGAGQVIVVRRRRKDGLPGGEV